MEEKKIAPIKQEPDGYHLTQFGNVKRMLDKFGTFIAWNDAYGYLLWNGTHWQTGAEKEIEQLAEETILSLYDEAASLLEQAAREKGSSVKRKKLSEEAETLNRWARSSENSKMVSDMCSLAKKHVKVDVALFDNDPDLLNCLNGVVNLRDGSITPHHSSQRFTYVVPVNYDPSIDTTEWEKFLQGTIAEEAVINYVQEALGYSLTGHTREEKLFYAVGPARGGKGTFAETVLSILPRPIGHSAEFNTFTRKREGNDQNFDLAPLKPARVVFASESNKYQSLNPAKIKQLTGGDFIDCAFKYGQTFSYRPQYKIWLLSNHPVNADPDDNALWGRVQVIPFPTSYLGREDTTLKERMKQPENLQQALKWAIDGSMKWYQKGKLTPPEKIVVTTQEQRDAQDTVKIWLDDCTVKKEGAFVSTKDLQASYQEWCNETGQKPVRPIDFIQGLKVKHGLQHYRKPKGGAMGFKGISLNGKTTVYISNGNGHKPESVNLSDLDKELAAIPDTM
jgi:putative DNA primase/helicase